MQYPLDSVLIEKGLVPNQFILELNGFLTVPHTFDLSGIWAYPSMMYRFPVDYSGGVLSVGSEHMKAHPFVKYCEQILGVDIPVSTDARGTRSGWGHAMDLIRFDMIDELEETAAFTTIDGIEHAIAHYVCWPKSCDRAPLTTKEARQLLKRFGIRDPGRDLSWIKRLSRPSCLTCDEGPDRWPVNPGFDHNRPGAWAHVHALEAGYFSTKSGWLQWTPDGRDFFDGKTFGTLF